MIVGVSSFFLYAKWMEQLLLVVWRLICDSSHLSSIERFVFLLGGWKGRNVTKEPLVLMMMKRNFFRLVV